MQMIVSILVTKHMTIITVVSIMIDILITILTTVCIFIRMIVGIVAISFFMIAVNTLMYCTLWNDVRHGSGFLSTNLKPPEYPKPMSER